MNSETKMLLVKSLRSFRTFKPERQRVEIDKLKFNCDAHKLYGGDPKRPEYVAGLIFLRIYKNKTV